jgi:spore coat protein CotF
MEFEKKPINEIKKPMNNDYLEIDNADGMPGLADATLAMEFLMSVKTGIRSCAISLTEIADPEARRAITGFLNDGIDLHEQLIDLFLAKGWLYPFEPDTQFRLDDISAKTALQIASLDLFPGNTSRLGTFATPNY